MNINEILNQLRLMSLDCGNESIYLPREITEIINGKQEEGWKDIRVDKLLNYIADMLEK